MNRRDDHGMTFIVKTVTRLTLGFILLYGVYIASRGHIAPGGGFAGGVIVALAFVQIMLAFGKKVALKRLQSNALRSIISLGALLFVGIVATNFAMEKVPCYRIFGPGGACPILDAELTLPFVETVIVGAGLFAIFVALVLVSKRDTNAE